MSQINTNAIFDASGGSTAQINGITPTAYNTMGRNRIINGDMRIDQRNAGAEINPAGNNTYCIDRWMTNSNVASKFKVQQNAGSVTPPTGFTYYLGATSLSAYSVGSSDSFALVQKIEGYNFADLDFGKATAKTVTISFWVRSSLTGTFGGSLTNSAIDRSYPFTYTVSSANTWEQKSVTIAGDTSGTWLTGNGIGAWLWFGLGMGSTLSGTAGSWAGADYRSATGATSVVGTSGATFYITGVQLEVGSVATEFERRPYGAELALCQRYFQKVKGGFGAPSSTTQMSFGVVFAPTMRAAPSFTGVGTVNATDYYATNASSASNPTITINISTIDGGNIYHGSWTGLVANRFFGVESYGNGSTTGIFASAEL